MSRNEWEHGTLVLPSAAVPAVRAAVRTATNTHFDAVSALCRTFVDDVARRTRSAKKFSAALDAWDPHRIDTAVAVDARFVLERVADAPRTIRRADVALVVPEANSRTQVFNFADFTIRFSGRNVSWTVPENNHAVDVAHAHPVAKAFFAALHKVTWTRGSGGTIAGNDEYNEESRGVGDGANYTTATFGPQLARR